MKTRLLTLQPLAFYVSKVIAIKDALSAYSMEDSGHDGFRQYQATEL